MPCHQSSVRLNSLESMWYCNIAVILTIFLVYDSHDRYDQYSSLPWPEDDYPGAELRLATFLLACAVILIVLFIPTQYFKVGNHANDQSKLGTHRKRKKSTDANQAAKPKENPGSDGESLADVVRFAVHTAKSSRKHLGPIGATIHITSAFCLILPVVFLQARAIAAGIFPPDMIWKSGVGDMYIIQVTPNSSTETSNGDQSQDPTSSSNLTNPLSSIEGFSTVGVTINILNYMVPLFLYAIRYADVFWECHKGFALIFSIQLMMNAMQYAVGFIGMSILYKLHWYGWEKYDMDIGPIFSSGPTLIPAYLINNLTVFAAAAILYLYGYGRLKRVQRKRSNAAENAHAGNLIALRYKGFLPQIGAMCALLIFISCKTPFIIEYMAVYRLSGDERMLFFVIFDCLFITVWFALWIFLTFKRNWEFSHYRQVEIIEMYDKDVVTHSSAERLEGLNYGGYTSIENETPLNSKGALEDKEKGGKDRPFCNGSLQMIYIRNGRTVDKYIRVEATSEGEEACPPVDSCGVPEAKENPALDSDVNILSNPLSTT